MRRIFQKTLLSILVGFLLACSSNVRAEGPEPRVDSPQQTGKATSPVSPESFPDVVARVNETLIQKEDFLARVAFVQEDMGLPEGDLSLGIYQTILNEMVDMELLYQASQVRNFKPEPAEIETMYLELVSRFPSEEVFLNQLNPPSMSAERFKEFMHRDLSVQKLVAEEFTPQVLVSDEEKRQFYDDNREKLEQPDQLRLRHILIRVEPGASDSEKERALKRIKEIRQQVLQQGGDFAEMAREFSEDPDSKERGGELVIRRGETVPRFEEAAFSLEPGGVSDIVETKFGYHVIKLSERIPAQVMPYDDVEPMIEELLRQRKLKSVIESEVETLRRQASIELFI